MHCGLCKYVHVSKDLRNVTQDFYEHNRNVIKILIYNVT